MLKAGPCSVGHAPTRPTPSTRPPSEPLFLPQPAGLKRYRAGNTPLVDGLYLPVHRGDDLGFWILLIRAGGEERWSAATDWFAVTALLGGPSACRPAHRRDPRQQGPVGAGRAFFVERNFPDPGWSRQTAQPDPGPGSTCCPRRARRQAGRTPGRHPPAWSSPSATGRRCALPVPALERQLGVVDLAAVLGRGIEARESDRHHELFDYIEGGANPDRPPCLDLRGGRGPLALRVLRGIDKRMAKA